MAYTPREIKDRVAVGDDIFIVEDLGNNRIKLIPAPTHVSEPGTPVNKALLQPIEDYLATGVVPVERTITAGNGLTGGGSLNANITLSLGAPGTLSGATSNNVTATGHTHAISVATKAEAEEGANNVKLMTPLRVKQAFDKRVVFAQLDDTFIQEGTVTRRAYSPTDYNTIKFTNLLKGRSFESINITLPSHWGIVVGIPQYQLSTSSLADSPLALEFKWFDKISSLYLGGIDVYHGFSKVGSKEVRLGIEWFDGNEVPDEIYLHFRFVGLKLT